ncbi:MAG: RluA family pseudouridine synthase [Cyclobacteriaceae bacterium]
MTSPSVLYEDNHLLILNKPAGWLVQGDKTGDKTITDWGRAYIKEKYNKPGEVFLHPCHRLDRPVSGITIFARTSKALERMNKLFREDDITKTYLAAVGGKPPQESGKLVHWLEKNGKNNTVKAFTKAKGTAKRAELDYTLLARENDLSLLKVLPKTGRAHQIRVQLSSMKCPIAGDLKYGFPKPNPDKSIHLHAFAIKFVHPVRKDLMEVNCKPNWDEFTGIINELD